MACVCPDIEREIGRMMNFVTEVTGDALEAMQDAWDDRESFTREELGGAPDWADYVDVAGELFPGDMGDEYCEMLTDVYGTVLVAGFEFDAGAVVREMDPIGFRCGMLDWLDMRVQDGDLRCIEG
nr:MAG TPA: hypothetical protein [Caudoviricetes sp.]